MVCNCESVSGVRRHLTIVARFSLLTRDPLRSLFTGGKMIGVMVFCGGSAGACLGLVVASVTCAYDACMDLGGGACVLLGICFAAVFRASQLVMICLFMVSIFAL